jgi:hypothetical protein
MYDNLNGGQKLSDRRIIKVKKTIIVILAVMALAAAGCQKKEEAPKAPAPKSSMPAQMPPGHSEMPAQPPGSNPHAGLKPVEIPAGAGHKGKVVETMNAAGYTYVQVEENGQKIWVAVMETKVKSGDIVEFPDSPPMLNFQSKSLNRVFDKIIFAPGLRIASK